MKGSRLVDVRLEELPMEGILQSELRSIAKLCQGPGIEVVEELCSPSHATAIAASSQGAVEDVRAEDWRPLTSTFTSWPLDFTTELHALLLALGMLS